MIPFHTRWIWIVGALSVLTCRIDIALASDIDLSLNLRYNHPADTSQGGIWSLVGLTDDLSGIASVRAIIDNVDNGPADVTFSSGIGAVDPVDLGGGLRPAVIGNGTILDLAYGQDLAGTVIPGVGTGFGAPGDIGLDRGWLDYFQSNR